MQNNGVLKSIALFLIVVFAVGLVFPSQEVMAIEQYLEVQTQRDTIIQQSNVTLPKGLSNSTDVAPVVSEPKINTELGNLAADLSLNFESLKEAYRNNDLSVFKQSIKDMSGLLDNYSKSILVDLDKNEEILEELDTEKGEQRNSKFRTEITQKLLEFKGSFEEFAENSKSIKDLKGPEAVKVKDGLDKIERIFMPGQPENPIGSNLPYRNVSAQPKVESIGAGAATPYTSEMGVENTPELPKEPQPEDLAETEETKLNDKIKELADSLGTPINIYEYVRNNMEFEPYYGSRKGAQGTLSHNGGNDYDQASLLISMLRYKKIPARYVRGQAEIEISRAMAWTGADTPEAAAQILASAGMPVTSMVSVGKIIAVRVEHVWVEAFVPYDRYRGAGSMKGRSIWIPLDPSYKLYEKVEGISNISDIIGINSETFDKAVKEQDANTGKVTGISTSGYDALLNSSAEKLEKYIIDNHLEDKTLAEVFGGLKIKPQKLGLLPASLPYKMKGTVSKFNKITEKYSDMVSFGVYGSDPYGLNFTGDKDFEIQYKAVELYNKKVTLSYEAATKEDADIIKQYGDIFSVPAYLVKMVPVLKVDGETVARGKEIGLGYRQQFEIGIKSTGREKELVHNDVTAGSFYNVGFDYQIVAEDELKPIADKLKNSQYTQENVYTDEKIGEILNFVAKSYFAEMDIVNKILMQQMNIFSVRQLSEGITGFRANVKYLFMAPVELSSGGLYIDVDSNANSVVSRSGDKDSEKQYMISSGMISSALEHSIWEQATGAEAVSTIKVLEIAAEQNIPIYLITQANYDEYKEKLHVSSSVKDEIHNAVNGGKIVTVASEEIELGDWSGAGYIVMDPETGSAGYMISGGIAGGASTEEVELAYFVDIGFAIWDFVEAILLLASVAAIFALNPIIGGIVLVLGIITLLFAIYTYFHTMYLLWEYYNGNEEAGQELIDDMKLNIIITLATFGLGRALKPIAKAVKKSRVIKVLGEELFETIAKNVDEGKDAVDELDKVIKSLKKSGASEDIIKEFGEKFNKKGLDWLNSKSALKFTDDELRKLAGLGDNLFDCSDELLDVFKNSSRQDEIIDAIAKNGKDAADVITSYKDEAVDLITKHGKDAVDAMKRGIDPTLIKKLDDLGIDPSKYDELGIVGRESAEVVAEAAKAVEKFIIDNPKTLTSADAPRLVREAYESLRTKVYRGVELVSPPGAKTFDGEFDAVDIPKKLFVEDKSALGLSNPKNKQTPAQWANKQIYDKTQTRINNLKEAIGVKPSSEGNGVVPELNEFKDFKDFLFKIDADTPELRQGVEISIQKLKAEFPEYNFSATFGG